MTVGAGAPLSTAHVWHAAATVELTERQARLALLRGFAPLPERTKQHVLEVFCYGGDVRYLTPQGLKDLRSTAGTTQKVLSQDFNGGRRPSRTDGKWVDARIESFGVQPVKTVTLTRDGVTKKIKATGNHIWYAARSDGGQAIAREVTTDALKPGYVLASLTTRFTPRQSVPSPFGITAGIVFGDGSRKNQRGSTEGTGCLIDLWGAKDAQLLRYFNGSPQMENTTLNGVKGIRVTQLPGFFKDPPPETESTSYLYGWLAGYFAADGTVSKTGAVSLCSAKREHLELVQRICLRLGLVTGTICVAHRNGFGDTPTPLYKLSFYHQTLRPEFFLIAEHRDRFIANPSKHSRLRWTVVAVEDFGEVEEVFCAVVPGTHNFVLEDYIWTHNCHQCRRPYDDVAGEPCSAAENNIHLRGGPIGERRRRKTGTGTDG